MIIDTHAHLMFKDFNGEVDAVLKRATDAGVEKIINVGCDVKTSQQAVEMAARDDLYATLGLHPYDSLVATDDLMEEWGNLISSNKKIVAVGECGLDYFKATIPKEDQKNAFRLQLALAEQTGLPVIIHNRDADEECLEILEEFDVKAVFHCFSGNVEFARKLWNKGYLTSFTGIITYPKAENVREVAAEVPLDKLMVETDCPFLAPQLYRGNRNEPAYVVEVVKKIAEIRGMSVDEVARLSSENAERFLARL